jgi:hypothetical protein
MVPTTHVLLWGRSSRLMSRERIGLANVWDRRGGTV